MTPYPVPGLTKAQREVFEQIALGNYTLKGIPHQKATIDKLLKLEAIVREADEINGSGWLAVGISSYSVPLPLHAAWCAENSMRRATLLNNPEKRRAIGDHAHKGDKAAYRASARTTRRKVTHVEPV